MPFVQFQYMIGTDHEATFQSTKDLPGLTCLPCRFFSCYFPCIWGMLARLNPLCWIHLDCLAEPWRCGDRWLTGSCCPAAPASTGSNRHPSCPLLTLTHCNPRMAKGIHHTRCLRGRWATRTTGHDMTPLSSSAVQRVTNIDWSTVWSISAAHGRFAKHMLRRFQHPLFMPCRGRRRAAREWSPMSVLRLPKSLWDRIGLKKLASTVRNSW